MSKHDDADLAAIRILQRLIEREEIDFVSSHGVSILAPVVSSLLLRLDDVSTRSTVLAAWLIDHIEVRDLYIDDEQLEQLLCEIWDAREHTEPAIEARRADIEAMLRSEPDNLDHRLVYGDWLQAHDDPLGELIARQLARASEPGNSALEQAAASYLREHASALFGPLAEYLDTVVRPVWRGGFIDAATLGRPRDDPESYEGAILLKWLLEHRTAMLLRELELQPFDYYSWGRDQLRTLLAVVLERPRPLLRRLSVGVDDGPGELGELAQLDELLPNLEVLELRVRSVTIERLRHPTLRRLLWHSAMGPRQAAALASFELPRLESLAVRWVRPHLQLAPILAELELPSLRSLQMPGTADNLDWLLRVGWRAQLEHLDLSGGDLQDEHARLLARQPWPRLRHLDVSNNEIGVEGNAMLTALAPTVVTGKQRPVTRYDDYEEDDDDEDDEYYEDAME